MYLVGDSFHISFKWVVIISTKQEAAHTQSAKEGTCCTLWHFGDWSLITERGGGGGGYKTAVGASEVLLLQKGGGGGGNSFSHAKRGAQNVLR